MSATLYARLGGYDAVAAVADALLMRLRADAQLGRFWENRGEESAGEKRMRDVAEEVGLVKGAREGRGMLAFDADGDGDEDLLMLHHVDGPMLWRNDVALHV